MEAQESEKKCVDNTGCPRTEMILRLINAGDKTRAGILQAMNITPTPEDTYRQQQLEPLVEQLEKAHPDGDRRITPLTCQVFHSCQAAVIALQKQMMNERGGMGMLAPGPQLPNVRQ